LAKLEKGRKEKKEDMKAAYKERGIRRLRRSEGRGREENLMKIKDIKEKHE
jgi:hypothetical protein